MIQKSQTQIFSFPAQFLLQAGLTLILFFLMSGFVPLLGWEFAKVARDGYRALVMVALAAGGLLSVYLYARDKEAFMRFEPARSVAKFFNASPIFSVGILFLFYFLTQFSHLALMHAGGETALWDLGFYDQILWNTANGRPLTVSVSGGLNLLGHHFEPIFLVLAPIYWFTDHIHALFGFIAFQGAANLLLVYLIARELTRDHVVSLSFAIAVFFFQPLQNAVVFPLQTQVFADPLLLLGFFLLLKRRNVFGLAALILATGCKDNIVIEVFGIGAFLFFQNRRALGGFIAAGAVLGAAAIALVIEPQFHWENDVWDKWNYFALFTNFSPESLSQLFRFNPTWFVLMMFGPFLFLSFRDWKWIFLLGPTLLFRFVSTLEGFRIITAHYTGGLNALIFISAIYGYAALVSAAKGSSGPRWLRYGERFVRDQFAFIIIVAALVFTTFSGRPQLFEIDKYSWQASQSDQQKVTATLEAIPESYSVMANERPAAHVTHRAHYFVFFGVLKDSPLEELSRRPDLVVFDKERAEPRDHDKLKQFIANGYERVHEVGYIAIYKRKFPEVVLAPELLTEWRRVKAAPVTPYRDWSRRAYAVLFGVLVLAGLVYLRRRTLELYHAHADSSAK